MSQDDTLSYKKLFALSKETKLDNLTKEVIKQIEIEYKNNHKNDYASFLSKFDVFPLECPRCNSLAIMKYGHTKNGSNRYKCRDCSKVFNRANKSLLFSSKVNINAWYSFLEGIVSEISVKAAARKAKISLVTASTWMKRIFIAIKDFQDEIELDGDVYIDETYYSKERSKEIKYNGLKLRGISANQYCVLIMKNKRNVVLKYIGMGKQSGAKVADELARHIKSGSTIYHDGDKSHGDFVKEDNVINKQYRAKNRLGLYNLETEEILKPINDECKKLNFFLNKHRGFKKEFDLQDYLNLYSYIYNQKYKSPNIFLITRGLFFRILSKKERFK